MNVWIRLEYLSQELAGEEGRSRGYKAAFIPGWTLAFHNAGTIVANGSALIEIAYATVMTMKDYQELACANLQRESSPIWLRSERWKNDTTQQQ